MGLAMHSLAITYSRSLRINRRCRLSLGRHRRLSSRRKLGQRPCKCPSHGPNPSWTGLEPYFSVPPTSKHSAEVAHDRNEKPRHFSLNCPTDHIIMFTSDFFNPLKNPLGLAPLSWNLCILSIFHHKVRHDWFVTILSKEISRSVVSFFV